MNVGMLQSKVPAGLGHSSSMGAAGPGRKVTNFGMLQIKVPEELGRSSRWEQ